jgi:predicted methyltransferase
MLRSFVIGFVVLAAAACSRQEPPGAASDQPGAVEAPVADTSADARHASVAAGIDSQERFAADATEDTWRKPEVILDLLGVEPGMEVIDVFAAGGYYTELLARVVGPEGHVIAYNNEPYARFAADQIAERYAAGRLPNVEQLTVDANALELPPASLDAALFVMSYHDLYWRPEDGSWPETDPADFLARLYVALRPGGVVVVEDHVAEPGGEIADIVGSLHRIDPEIVKRDFANADFVFDGESGALAHPDDDHSKLVFDESVRHRTDQFIFRFVKPASVASLYAD